MAVCIGHREFDEFESGDGTLVKLPYFAITDFYSDTQGQGIYPPGSNSFGRIMAYMNHQGGKKALEALGYEPDNWDISQLSLGAK